MSGRTEVGSRPESRPVTAAAATGRTTFASRKVVTVRTATLGLILAGGLALRIWGAIDPAVPGHDGAGYLAIAASLFETGTYDDSVARGSSRYSPGLPLLYAAAYAVTGGVHPLAGRVVMAVVGTLAVCFTYLIGMRVMRTRPEWERGTVALLAAAAVAFSPSLLQFGRGVFAESLALAVLTGGVLAFLWACDRGTAWAWLVPGAAFGLTALARPEYLALALLFAPLAVWRSWSRVGGRGAVLAGVIAAGATLVVIAPWTIRNAVATGEFTPISSGSGVVLYIGSDVASGGRGFETKQRLLEKYPDVGRLPRPSKPAKPLEPTRLDRLLAREARARHPGMDRDAALGRIGRENHLRLIGEQPITWIGFGLGKIWRMWNIPTTAVHLRGEWVPLGRPAPALANLRLAVLALALVGIAALAWRRRFEVVALVLPLVYVSATAMIVSAPARRIVPLLAIVSILAAIGLVSLLSGAISLSGRRRAGATG